MLAFNIRVKILSSCLLFRIHIQLNHLRLLQVRLVKCISKMEQDEIIYLIDMNGVRLRDRKIARELVRLIDRYEQR